MVLMSHTREFLPSDPQAQSVLNSRFMDDWMTLGFKVEGLDIKRSSYHCVSAEDSVKKAVTAGATSKKYCLLHAEVWWGFWERPMLGLFLVFLVWCPFCMFWAWPSL